MGYYTYFQGEIKIELNEPHVSKLQNKLLEDFNGKDVIKVNEHSLTVNDEWKNGRLMENTLLFIKEHGKLLSGKILCSGEDQDDVWEIFISDGKPHICEIGTAMTLARSEHFKDPEASVVEIVPIGK